MRNTSRKNISFTQETLSQLKEIMFRYETENTSEIIRRLIENEYNRLKNPSAKADTKDSRLTDIETSLAALTAKLNDLNRMTYEVRDMTNSYALMLESGEMEMSFHSADENVRDANLSSCLVKSRENYKEMRHARTVEKGMLNSMRDPNKR